MKSRNPYGCPCLPIMKTCDGEKASSNTVGCKKYSFMWLRSEDVSIEYDILRDLIDKWLYS